MRAHGPSPRFASERFRTRSNQAVFASKSARTTVLQLSIPVHTLLGSALGQRRVTPCLPTRRLQVVRRREAHTDEDMGTCLKTHTTCQQDMSTSLLSRACSRCLFRWISSAVSLQRMAGCRHTCGRLAIDSGPVRVPTSSSIRQSMWVLVCCSTVLRHCVRASSNPLCVQRCSGHLVSACCNQQMYHRSLRL